MVLFKPQSNVLDVLETSGISILIPVFNDLKEAKGALVRHQKARPLN
jgi:hypothetical protein